MADLSAQITPAYVHTVSDIFEEVIKNRGTALRNYVSQEALPTPCYKHAIMQYDTGEASRIKNGSEPVKTTPVLTGKRIMMPDSFGNAISLDGYDSRRAKLPDEGLLANKLAESMGRFLDNLILHGMSTVGGVIGAYRAEKVAQTGALTETFINLNTPTIGAGRVDTIPDDSNIISWNNLAFFDDTLTGAPVQPVKNVQSYAGLSSGKIDLAVTHLQTLSVPPPYLCVASSYALSTMRADPRLANSLLNYAGPVMSTAQNAPYAGIDWFIPCESVKKNVPSVYNNAAGTSLVEYAYIFNPAYIRLGSTLMENITMEPVNGVWRQILIKTDAMYDCVRTQEKAVVIIEIKKGVGATSFTA